LFPDIPRGLARAWHSAKVWQAIGAWLMATGSAAGPLILYKMGVQPMTPAELQASIAMLVKVAGAGAVALGGIVISSSGLEDAFRKMGVTDSLPGEPSTTIVAKSESSSGQRTVQTSVTAAPPKGNP
jgi:hypothetical protein